MATYPIKVLLDRNRQPFIPFATTSSIVENGTNRRLDKILGNLDDLQTNNKNSLVSAINEILTQHGSGGSSTGWQVVDVLPTENISATTIYLLPKEGATKPNIYEEWIWVNEDWESIGTTEIDLTGYATTTMIGDLNTLQTTDKDSVVDAINELVNKQLVAGENITINGNVINANTSEHIYEINPAYLSHTGYMDKTIISELITKMYTDGTEDPILRVRPTGRNSMISDINYYDFKLSSAHYPFSKTSMYYFFTNPIFTISGSPINSNNVSLVCGYIYISGSWTDDIFTCNKLGYNVVFDEYLSNIALLTNVLSKTNTTSYTPTNDYHPATKKYVDDAIAAAGTGSGSAFDPAKYLAIDNTTEYTPTDLYHPATKAYVDSQIASVPEPVDAYSKTEIDGKLSNYLSKTNTESYTPTSDYHPATKKFVESVVASIPGPDLSNYYTKDDIETILDCYNTHFIYDAYSDNITFTDPENLTKAWDFNTSNSKVFDIYGDIRKGTDNYKLVIFKVNTLVKMNAHYIDVTFNYESNTGVRFDNYTCPQFYYVDDDGVEQVLNIVVLSDSRIEGIPDNLTGDKKYTYHYLLDVWGSAVGKEIYMKRHINITALAAMHDTHYATFAHPQISARLLVY